MRERGAWAWPRSHVIHLRVILFRLVPSGIRVPKRGRVFARALAEGSPESYVPIESEPAGYNLRVDRYAYLTRVVADEAVDAVTPHAWDILEGMIHEMVRTVGTPRHALWQAWVEPRPLYPWTERPEDQLEVILREAHR